MKCVIMVSRGLIGVEDIYLEVLRRCVVFEIIILVEIFSREINVDEWLRDEF